MKNIKLYCLLSCSFVMLMFSINGNSLTNSQTLSSRIATVQQKSFPRLIGMNIGSDQFQYPTYQAALAKMDVVIVNFIANWSKINSNEPIRDAVRAIKQINPNILIGQYTMLTESQSDEVKYPGNNYKIDKLNQEDWWLHNADGSMVQWTNVYDSWEINFTNWVKADANGLRYPEWLADQDFNFFFNPVPEFDIWYFDGVVSDPRVSGNWKADGGIYSNKDPVIQQAVRAGFASHWARSKQHAPGLLLLGNTDNDLSFPEYKNKLNAAFLEGLMGKSWSLETWAGWDVMMQRYQSVFPNLLAPKLVGFNVWGNVNDYRFFRYALASCLMDNGFFSFTDAAVGYASVPWFDEYNVNLGNAVDSPQQVQIYQGVHIRKFEHGLVLVNPTADTVIVPVSPGYKHIKGVQDPIVNDGSFVMNVVSMEPKSGLILTR
jgi:hypothetical protein